MKSHVVITALAMAFAGAAYAVDLPNVPANDNMQQANPKAAKNFRDLADKTKHGAQMAIDKTQRALGGDKPAQAQAQAPDAKAPHAKAHHAKAHHAKAHHAKAHHAKAHHAKAHHAKAHYAKAHHASDTRAMGAPAVNVADTSSSRQQRMDAAYADWQAKQRR
ncbi:hypothetical protein [Ramlibacter albus]|uniref:Uncharacterized protein n=1 Tax=Ramlibacter albus TaxID=2079448 RepID=A0A923MDC2_9BURK|nr:hypothetical protein [Ramlibacter albus]MBC5767319.1 hypothetical protein [Ramlibacter albus]